MSRQSSAAGILPAVILHVTLWALFAAVLAFMSRDKLFPGRPYLTWALLVFLIAFVAALWTPGKVRGAALMALNTISIVALVILLAEVVLTVREPKQVAITRYPFPYRMHGFNPSLASADNRMFVTSNDTGLRDPESIGRKPEGEFRVVVLGGSAILGVGARDDETAPHQLGLILNDRLRTAPLEGIDHARVINAGQGWYNSTQELVFLATELALYEPDLVVVVDGYNDLHHAVVWGNRPPSNHVSTAQLEDLLYRPGTFRELSWDQALHTALRASAIFSRARRGGASAVISPQGVGHASGRLRRADSDETFLPLVQHRIIMNWTLMHHIAEAGGARAIFSLQPTVFVKDPLSTEEADYVARKDFSDLVTRTWREMAAFVDEESRRLGLRTFEADVRIRAIEDHVFVDYCHLVPDGNRLMAEAIADRVTDEWRTWPWKADWDGVRYPFAEGDPIWRPLNASEISDWR